MLLVHHPSGGDKDVDAGPITNECAFTGCRLLPRLLPKEKSALLRFARTLSNLRPERRNTQVKTGAKEGAGRWVLHGVSVVLNLPFGAFEMLTTYQLFQTCGNLVWSL